MTRRTGLLLTVASTLALLSGDASRSTHTSLGGVQRHAESHWRTAEALPRLRITVRFRNWAQVQPMLLEKSQNEASKILRTSGVAITWLDCSGDNPAAQVSEVCARTVQPAELVLTIGQRSEAAPKHVLGVALLAPPGEFAHYATIFQDAAVKLAWDPSSTADVLGYAMAHEIGHLLLGHRHSPTGIMRPELKRGELRRIPKARFRFTERQAALLREAVLVRTLAQRVSA